MDVATFLKAVTAWAEGRCDVVGVALVGSYARGTARHDSDVDLVLLSEDPAHLCSGSWPARFGEVLSSSIEDYGAVKSRRIFYRDGLEVEFGIAAPTWASVPLDAGTSRVLTDGCNVLYDPEQLFRKANEAGVERPHATLGVLPAVMRSAAVEDAPDLVRVLRASRLRFLPYAPPTHSAAEDLDWARNRLIPGGGVTVATVRGTVVGVLAVRAERDASWIDQLYVQPECCGRGVGSGLMRVALSSLRRPIRLYTFQANHKARRFYERFGFVPIEWGDGSGNEEGCPDVLYELVDGLADGA